MLEYQNFLQHCSLFWWSNKIIFRSSKIL